MKQVLIQKGQIIIEEVPAPIVQENSVLVEVSYSLISTGTELVNVTASGESLIKKVMKHPEKIKKIRDMVRDKGVSQAFSQVKGRLETAQHLGYSCSGMVSEVGKNIRDIKIGDRVACAGFGYANHAQIVCVPRNLVVKIPENLGLKEAASVTLGAIAMQGVRRADPRIGEFVAVIGLGLIGQIVVQILKAAGCRVAGVDIEKNRVEIAKKVGMDLGITSNEEDPVSAVLRFSNGYGADSTIITASSKSNLPVKQALEMTRRKGRIVVVGDVGLHIDRKPFYEKELDFLISTSYGPGRYDEIYEEKSIDYPYSYVRWTENRNMQEYLRLLAEGKINIERLITKEYLIEEAQKAYDDLKEDRDKSLSIFLKYKDSLEHRAHKSLKKLNLTPQRTLKPIKSDRINVALIGAGNFAKAVHLPNLKKLSNLYNIYAIVSNTGSNAKETARLFDANYCSTDYREVLQDENINLIMICTRHNLHAKIAIEALKAGKHVFVEKPLCINKGELEEINKTYNSRNLSLSVGFNRRFSPYAQRIKEIIKDRLNPMIINYRMNAGLIPKDHWINTEEGGGRNIGEACHIYDLFNYFTESEVLSADAKSITPVSERYNSNDNFVATVKYKDGSVCSLTYSAIGSADFPKEEMEIYFDEKLIELIDYKELKVFGLRGKNLSTRTQDKGHLEMLRELSNSLINRQEIVPFWQLIQTTEISFSIEEKINQ